MKTSLTPYSIVIVDDHPLIRAGITALLSRQSDLQICGEAGDADEAVELITRVQPDLVILDMSLRSGTGMDVIRRLNSAPGRRADGAVRILVHSMYEDSIYAERVLEAGAMGYLNKNEDSTQLLVAIRRILSGKVYLSPAMTDHLLHHAIGHRGPAETNDVERLTDRELQVFRMIGEAIPTRRIAEQLFLSVHTVESHRENIKKKLGLSSGSELNKRAFQWVLENG